MFQANLNLSGSPSPQSRGGLMSPFSAASPIPSSALMNQAISMSTPPPPMVADSFTAHLAPEVDLRYGQNYNAMYGGNLFDSNSVDRAAKMYRNAATVCDATCTWSGQLPPRNYKNPMYSCKVFVGGVPWDITESTQSFDLFRFYLFF